MTVLFRVLLDFFRNFPGIIFCFKNVDQAFLDKFLECDQLCFRIVSRESLRLERIVAVEIHFTCFQLLIEVVQAQDFGIIHVKLLVDKETHD